MESEEHSMRVEYEIVELTRARTPSVLRAKVLEKHTANSLERALGKRDRAMEREWVGCEIWHEAGHVGKIRAPKKLERYLASKNHMLDQIEEVVQCPLQRLVISFGRNFA